MTKHIHRPVTSKKGRQQTMRQEVWCVRFGSLKANARSFVAGSSHACPSYGSGALGELAIPASGVNNGSKLVKEHRGGFVQKKGCESGDSLRTASELSCQRHQRLC